MQHIKYKGVSPKIFRIDVAKGHKFLAKAGIAVNQVPSIHVLVDGEVYQYTNGLHFFENANQFMNRLANPIISVTSEDQLSEFLDNKKQLEHDMNHNDYF